MKLIKNPGSTLSSETKATPKTSDYIWKPTKPVEPPANLFDTDSSSSKSVFNLTPNNTSLRAQSTGGGAGSSF